MLNDPIADYLTRIRNAIRAGHDEVEIPYSGLKLQMSRILKEQGYITDFERIPATVGEAINTVTARAIFANDFKAASLSVGSEWSVPLSRRNARSQSTT